MSGIYYMTLILTHAEDTDGLHNETGLSSTSITRYVDTTDFSTIATRRGVPREQKLGFLCAEYSKILKIPSRTSAADPYTELRASSAVRNSRIRIFTFSVHPASFLQTSP